MAAQRQAASTNQANLSIISSHGRPNTTTGTVASRIQAFNARAAQAQTEAAQAHVTKSRPPTPTSRPTTPVASTTQAFRFQVHPPSNGISQSPVDGRPKKPMPGHWPGDDAMARTSVNQVPRIDVPASTVSAVPVSAVMPVAVPAPETAPGLGSVPAPAPSNTPSPAPAPGPGSAPLPDQQPLLPARTASAPPSASVQMMVTKVPVAMGLASVDIAPGGNDNDNRSGLGRRETLRFQAPAGPRTDFAYEHHGRRDKQLHFDDTDYMYDLAVTMEPVPKQSNNGPKPLPSLESTPTAVGANSGEAEKRGVKRLSEGDAGAPWIKFKRLDRDERRLDSRTSSIPLATPAQLETRTVVAGRQLVSEGVTPAIPASGASTAQSHGAQTVLDEPLVTGQPQATLTLTVSNLPITPTRDQLPQESTISRAESELIPQPGQTLVTSVNGTEAPLTQSHHSGSKLVVEKVGIAAAAPLASPAIAVATIAAQQLEKTVIDLNTMSDHQVTIPQQDHPQAVRNEVTSVPAQGQDSSAQPAHKVYDSTSTDLNSPDTFNSIRAEPVLLPVMAEVPIPGASPTPVVTATGASSHPPEVSSSPTPAITLSTGSTSSPPLKTHAGPETHDSGNSELKKVSEILDAILLDHRDVLEDITAKLSLELSRLSADWDCASGLASVPRCRFPEPHRSIAAVTPGLREQSDLMVELVKLVAAAAEQWHVDLSAFTRMTAKEVQKDQRARAATLSGFQVDETLPLRRVVPVVAVDGARGWVGVETEHNSYVPSPLWSLKVSPEVARLALFQASNSHCFVFPRCLVECGQVTDGNGESREDGGDGVEAYGGLLDIYTE